MSNQQELFEKKEKEPKFKSCKGSFILENHKIGYTLKAETGSPYHFEFKGDKPNPISETGYKSWFVDFDIEEYNSIEEVIRAYLDRELNRDFNISFETQKKKRVIEKEVGKEVGKDTSWDKINEMIERCKKSNQEYIYFYVRYFCNYDLTEKKESLNVNSTHKKPKGELGSSYGNWGIDTKKSGAEIMERFLEQKRTICELPLADVKGIATTTLNADNFIISFSNKAREYLEKKGFDFKEFEKQLDKIKQKKATDEDVKKSKTFILMEKQLDKLRDECWVIKGYFEYASFLTSYKSKNYYKEKLIELKIDFSDLNKLKDLYEKKAKIYHTLYQKVYEMRWGKPCNEEYSYP